MTNVIPPHIATPSVPMQKEERSLLGKWGFLTDRSFAGVARYLILRGAEAEDPELAAKIKAIRAQARQLAAQSPILIAGLVTVFQVTFGYDGHDRCRPRLTRPRTTQQIASRQPGEIDV